MTNLLKKEKGRTQARKPMIGPVRTRRSITSAAHGLMGPRRGLLRSPLPSSDAKPARQQEDEAVVADISDGFSGGARNGSVQRVLAHGNSSVKGCRIGEDRQSHRSGNAV